MRITTSLVVIAIVVIGIIAFATAGISLAHFKAECEAHGGAHVTFPYKQLPECWDAEGRRVFW